jgi:hypothetical protein
VVRVVGLLAVAGCQLAYPEQPAAPPSACGSFRIEAEEVFEGLDEVSEFSVAASGNEGFVKAVRTGDTQPFLHAIAKIGDTWRIDAVRSGGAVPLSVLQSQNGLRAGRASPAGDLFGAVIDLQAPTVFSQVIHYQFSDAGNGWGPHAPAPTELIAEDSTIPGGAIEVPQQFGVIRQVPVLHYPEQGERFLSVLVQLDDDNENTLDGWTELLDDGVLATDAVNATHEDIDQASLAIGPNGAIVMAYQATDGGQSRLFLGEKAGEQFPRGVHLDEIDGEGNEVEPFLSPDCKTLWFRRGRSILRAVSDSP